MNNYKDVIMEILVQKIEQLQGEIEFLELKNEKLQSENAVLRRKEAEGFMPEDEHTFAE